MCQVPKHVSSLNVLEKNIISFWTRKFDDREREKEREREKITFSFWRSKFRERERACSECVTTALVKEKIILSFWRRKKY